MSAGESVWNLINELARAMDGDRESSERHLNQLETELRSLPRTARNEARRQMIHVVAAISRLEVRMIESDGPLPAGV